ncbi:hypothetical protein IW136_000682 [Coemansia sp. RSA 678]|nr:hypothetical protein IW136_000682 [Coemansia sp. RSA 678]
MHPNTSARSRAASLLLASLLGVIAVGFAQSLIAHSSNIATQSSLAGAAPWWAAKRSVLNTHGAKVAWGWTSALFAAAAAVRAPARAPSATAAAALRYVLATLYWVAMARWFFGPPLFDRVFVRTGGSCLPTAPDAATMTSAPVASLQACRAAGGRWAGGHDVSGHCFLLIHSALFLAEEAVAPLLAVLSDRRHTSPALATARRAALAATLGLVGVWVFMLYATARYFHGIHELLSGTVLGVAYWAALYRSGVLGPA